MTDKQRLDWIEKMMRESAFHCRFNQGQPPEAGNGPAFGEKPRITGFSIASQHVDLPATATLRDLIDAMVEQSQHDKAHEPAICGSPCRPLQFRPDTKCQCPCPWCKWRVKNFEESHSFMD